MSETTITKTCRTCKQTKSVSEFYKAKRNRDGYANQCKICDLKQYAKYAKTEKGKQARRRAEQQRAKTEKRKMAQTKYNKKYRRTENGKAIQAEALKRYAQKHPERLKAKRAVENAIKAGKLPRPDTFQCSYCPKQAEQYHHHKGYAQKHWLDVIPMCFLCHRTLPRLAIKVH